MKSIGFTNINGTSHKTTEFVRMDPSLHGKVREEEGKKSFFRHLHIIDVACCINIRYLQIKFILVHDSFHIGLAPSSRDSQSVPKSLVRGSTLFWNNLRQVRSKSKLENQRYDMTIVLSIAHAWVIDRSSHIIIPICTEILFSKKKCVFDLIGCKTVRRYKSKRLKMTHE